MKIESKDIPGFSIVIGEDGVWVNFNADGLHGSINIHNAISDKSSITREALIAWVNMIEMKETDWRKPKTK